MKNSVTFLKNENGAMMIILSVMVLALLTIISISALRTANIELKIAGNEYRHQQNFYYAEAAVIEAVDHLDALEKIPEGSISWMMTRTGITNFDDKIYDFWKAEKGPGDAIPKKASLGNGYTELMAVHHGALSGSSLDMSKSIKHIFSIYGKSSNKGLVMIRLGFTKAY